MGAVPDVPHLKFLPNRYLIYDIQEKFMDNIYVNYLLTALILTFAIPGAGVVIEQFVKLLYSVTMNCLMPCLQRLRERKLPK